MSNNINSNNLKPFKEKVLNEEFNYTDFIKKLPLIPKISFIKNDKKDEIGSKIINNFFTIKLYLEQLEIAQKYILSILLMYQCELDKIKISNNKYKLLKKNLIITFQKTYNETFRNNLSFTSFLNKFINNNHNILENYKDLYPYFYMIFEKEYQDFDKNFFLNLFKKYNNIRYNLLKFLENNNSNIEKENNNSNIEKVNNNSNIEKEKINSNIKKNSKIN
jgi:hypothetical protein